MRGKSLFPKVDAILSLSIYLSLAHDPGLTIVHERSEMERQGAKERERERESGEEMRLNKQDLEQCCWLTA